MLPACIGAVDGTLIPIIPCKKPTKAQARGDTDAYYGYKGFISTLLLAGVDTIGRFIYVLGGAPGCCGDTRLFGNSLLKDLMSTGIFTQTIVEITLGKNVHEINLYMVGDSVFTSEVFFKIKILYFWIL